MLLRALARSGVCRAVCGQRRLASQVQLDQRVKSTGRAAQIAKRKLSAAVAAQKKQVAQAKQQQARQKASQAKQKAASRAQAAKAKAQAAAARKKAAQARGAAVAAAKALKAARAGVLAARKGVMFSRGAGGRRVALSKLKTAKKRQTVAAGFLKRAVAAVRKPGKLKVAAKRMKRVAKNARKASKKAEAALKLKLKRRTTAARHAAKAAAAAFVRAKKARSEGLKQKQVRSKPPKVSKRAERRRLHKQAGPSSPYALFMKDALKGCKPGSGAVQGAAAQWRGMSDAEKQPYVREAAQNRAKYQQLKAEAKGSQPINKRNAFFKQHFAAAYEEARRSGADRKEAFRVAVRTVNAKWKQQQ